MKKVQLGNSDLQVSVACLGTMVRSAKKNCTLDYGLLDINSAATARNYDSGCS